jgi:hypothetical protein
VKDYTAYNATNAAQGCSKCLPDPTNCSEHQEGKTLEQCVEICEADSDCGGIVYKAETMWCWKRANIEISMCNPGTTAPYTTLVKPTLSNGPMPPLLYAATLSDGPMPPLPGY